MLGPRPRLPCPRHGYPGYMQVLSRLQVFILEEVVDLSAISHKLQAFENKSLIHSPEDSIAQRNFTLQAPLFFLYLIKILNSFGFLFMHAIARYML
jgi:hypothetical protein